jgi:hypothetical protein
MAKCTHPDCTGVHDNNRFSELCPRSRAAKRIKDMRYLHSEKIIGGRLTVGSVVQQHRWWAAWLRRCIRKYGPDSLYAELFTDAHEKVARYERKLAEEMEKFRADREGHRGTRSKIDTICMGPFGLITERMVLAATRNPSLRTYYV